MCSALIFCLQNMELEHGISLKENLKWHVFTEVLEILEKMKNLYLYFLKKKNIL